MNLFLTIFVIFIISFIFALFSMRDLGFDKEIKKILTRKKIKGTVIFLKNKIIHYSSNSSSSFSKGGSS